LRPKLEALIALKPIETGADTAVEAEQDNGKTPGDDEDDEDDP